MRAEDGRLNDEEEFVRRLQRLAPSEEGLDRDALLFQAGYEAGRQLLRRRQNWMGAAALVMGCATVALWVDRQRDADVVPAPVAVRRSDVVKARPDGEGSARRETVVRSRGQASREPHPSSYLALRRMDAGDDWVRKTSPAVGIARPGQSTSRWQLERELLRRPSM